MNDETDEESFGAPKYASFVDQDEYRLSFGTGGLYVSESSQLIQSFDELHNWVEVIEIAVEKNLLQFKSTQSTRRAVREICTRLWVA